MMGSPDKQGSHIPPSYSLGAIQAGVKSVALIEVDTHTVDVSQAN